MKRSTGIHDMLAEGEMMEAAGGGARYLVMAWEKPKSHIARQALPYWHVIQPVENAVPATRMHILPPSSLVRAELPLGLEIGCEWGENAR